MRINESYDNYNGIKPLIEATDNAFKITLFNTNSNENIKTPKVVVFTESEQKILDLFEKKIKLKEKMSSTVFQYHNQWQLDI